MKSKENAHLFSQEIFHIVFEEQIAIFYQNFFQLQNFLMSSINKGAQNRRGFTVDGGSHFVRVVPVSNKILSSLIIKKKKKKKKKPSDILGVALWHIGGDLFVNKIKAENNKRQKMYLLFMSNLGGTSLNYALLLGSFL